MNMKTPARKKQEALAVAAVRALCIDEINKAKSGHPGMALGSAPILTTLFLNHLNIDPKHPHWMKRDRFVLSAGHASSLLYALLHLAGYGLTMEDLKSFRQVDSLTPGHPEYVHTLGVDATTGPLGQGIAQAVGMALASKHLTALYPDGDKLFEHKVYSLCGDGCLEEGISQEAISFAGHNKLNNLILIYDANDVTLDGGLNLSNSENAKYRFLSANWDVLEVKDGNDIDAIDKALQRAKLSVEKPTLIIVHTIIGYGSKLQGTNKVHGSPLGEEDGLAAKKSYGYDYPNFFVPEEVYDLFKQSVVEKGEKAYQKYEDTLKWYEKVHPEQYQIIKHTLENDVSEYLPKEIVLEKKDSVSTRVASGNALNWLVNIVPNLFGGSADVAHSVMTSLKDKSTYSPNCLEGVNINYGIREFAMAAINNGILLHGGLRSYGGCFLVFADYLKPAIRIASLSKLPAIYLFSHDSIAVGEDGPTHQPIEQLAMLRSIPHVDVYRPADEMETYASWLLALKNTTHPSCLILSRQNLTKLDESSLENVEKGGYIASKEKGLLMFTILATGSEVSLAIEAQKILEDEKIYVRVVSLPSLEVFARQDEKYQKEVLGTSYDKRISCEMLSTFGWARWAKYQMGLDDFGASGPAKEVIAKFDFTSEHLVKMIKKILKN